MKPGLQIQTKRRRGSIGMVLFGALALVVAVSTIAYTYRWYVRGDVPPVPLLASAIAATPPVDHTPVNESEIVAHTVTGSEPRYISIPTIGIDKSRIFSIDTDSNGELTLPDALSDAGWYKKSVQPGEGYGVALLNGRKLERSVEGTFAYADDLTAGDEIKIERGDNKTIIYKVIDTTTYTLQELQQGASKELMQGADPDKENLNLIIYTGNWVPRDNAYDTRLLVRAVRVQ